MFAQDGVYSEYVDTFFAGNSHPNISWINDVGKDRYGAAANALFGESRRVGDLETKHVCLTLKCCGRHRTQINPAFQLMLSIGKLSQLAQMQNHDVPTEKSALDGNLVPPSSRQNLSNRDCSL